MSVTRSGLQAPRMWLGGEPIPALSGQTFEVINPATEEAIAEVPRAGALDASAALDVASEALRDWRGMPGIERAGLLHGFAAAFRSHKERLATLITQEMGRPLVETLDEVEWCAAIYDFYAELGRGNQGHTVSPGQRGQTNYVVKEPFGVVVAITPWNYPLLLMTWKTAPALAAGNTVVVKPSELSPLSSLAVGEIAAGLLPPGTLNIVTGFGHEVGSALVEHARTDLITFTGSTQTGKRIAVAAAERLKKVHLELGGSDPLIVCDDVDLDVAARAAAWSAFLNNGQVCTSSKRLLVFDHVYEAFVDKLVEHTRRLRLGNPMGPDVDLGPMVSASQRDRLEAQVAQAASEGVRFRTGAARPSHLSRGWFYEPTVAINVGRDSVLMKDEVFGPVRPVVRVEDLDDAIRTANQTPYGLGASLFTTRLDRAMEASERIRSGTFWINDPLTDNHAAPFGGMKASGLGRELGLEGLDEFRQSKHVHLNHRVEQKSYWFPYNWETGRNKNS